MSLKHSNGSDDDVPKAAKVIDSNPEPVKEQDYEPPDGGWMAWFVVFGAFCVSIMSLWMSGVMKPIY